MIPEIITTGAVATAASKIKEDSLLGMLYKDTFQPSVQAIGKALGSTIEFCTTPLLLCKFGSETAQLNFKKRLDSYAKKLEGVPEEQSLPVNPQIGIPILERLTYTTNDEIAELFLNLLAKASSSENVNLAHPAFINIIERITPDEALILNSLEYGAIIPYIGLQANVINDGGHNVIKDGETSLKFDIDMQFPSNCNTYLDNLTSLGILIRHKDAWLAKNDKYDDLYLKYYYAEFEKVFLEASKNYSGTQRTKGMYKVTTFGDAFIKACVKQC